MARKTKIEALKTRQNLIDVAIILFAKHGVSCTTLADIADEAGMTRGAIYWHFDSKASLFNEIWNQQHPLIQEIKESIKPQLNDDSLTLLRSVMIEALRFIATNERQRLLLQIVYHMCEFNGEMYRENEIRQRIWFRRERMAKMLQNCISQGKIPPHTNIDMASTIIHGFFSGIVKNWLMQPENLNLYEKAPELVDNLLAMLKNGCH